MKRKEIGKTERNKMKKGNKKNKRQKETREEWTC